MYYRLYFLLGTLVLPWVLSAQRIPADSPEEILKKRQEAFGLLEAIEDPYEDSLWYHGRIYDYQLKSRNGTPYFENSTSLPGNVIFNGKLHSDLVIYYNLETDELILRESPNSITAIQVVLNEYFVEGFSLNFQGMRYNFNTHTELKPIHDRLNEGFYEVIYDDIWKMYVKHRKKLIFNDFEAEPFSYQYEKQVYVIRNGKIKSVDSRRNYLRLFKEQRKSLRKYLRKEHINFEKSGTQSLIDLCVYTKSLLDKQEQGIEGTH